MDDAQLVRKAKRGERDAFDELARRHERAMLAVARAYFASDSDAQDAAQTAFLKAFQSLGDLQNGRCFASWLMRITVRVSLDILRARSDKVPLADLSSRIEVKPRVRAADLTPASLAVKNEEAELVRAAVGGLPEEQRIVLMLRYTEQMSYKTVAEYLNVPVSTVRGRLYKAKLALGRALKALSAGVT